MEKTFTRMPRTDSQEISCHELPMEIATDKIRWLVDFRESCSFSMTLLNMAYDVLETGRETDAGLDDREAICPS